MTIHYVDSNASGLNDGTSKTNAFADFDTANNSTATLESDTYLASHLHSKDYGAKTTLAFPDDIKIYSISFTTDALLAGAWEGATGGVYDLIVQTENFGKRFYSNGVSFSAGDDLDFNKVASQYTIENVTIAFTGTGGTDYVNIDVDGTSHIFKNLTFNPNVAGQAFQSGGGERAIMRGGSVNSTCTQFCDFLGNGGSSIYVSDFDFSLMTSGRIFGLLSINDDAISVEMVRCKVPLSSVSVITNDKVYSSAQEVSIYSCDIGDGFYYFSYWRFAGKGSQNTAIKRANGSTYDGTNGQSMEIIVNTDAQENVYYATLPLKEIELDMTTAKYIDVYIMQVDSAGTPVALTDHQFNILVTHPDPTDNALGVTLTSKPEDVLATPVNLPTDATETWTGATGTQTKQYARVQLPVVTGMTKAPLKIQVEVSKQTGATERLFVCPKPEITAV